MNKADALSGRYETGFLIFMAVLAFLGRDNPNLDYPQVLYLFLLLMVLNLAAGIALRLKPEVPSLAAGFILANCGVITEILAHSGGAASNLWVLYLLPIFTVCLLLGPRETVWITTGVVALNAVFTLNETVESGSVMAFGILLKSGFFIFTALLTWRLASRDRDARSRLQAESRRADQLTTRLESAAVLSDAGLVSVGVAHDLRNTFTVILGFVDTALLDESLSDEARDAVERVKRMAALGGGMAAQLARHGAAAPVELAVDDLGSIGADVAVLVRNAYQAKNVSLEVPAPAEACPIRASRVHLQRLFLNLLLNALSISKSGARVRLLIWRGAGEALAVVEDEGAGFPAEILPRLFGAYETTRASSGGTGLGLNLCARIAREHGGSLTAENRPEGGARLRLSLPLAKP